ncbi:hypothetical protein AB0F81_34375 [Actinoplanes sp. NPDC024001]
MIRKTEPQGNRLSSSPPMTGPIAKPAAKVAADPASADALRLLLT